MAFSLLAYTSQSQYDNGYVVNMTAGAPYKLESFEDAGPAEVARFSQSSPDQHGATDLGFRIQPRLFVAKINFRDGNDVNEGLFGDNREWLFSEFRPSRQVYLRLTRDDGEVRILECHTQQIEIELVPEHYPARLNRATITLRAASPLWYTVTQKSPSYAGTSTWWTGNGAIGTANLMERTHYPAQGQAWTYQGTITGAWTVAVRSGSVPIPGGGGVVAMFHAGTGHLGTADALSKDVRIHSSTADTWMMGPTNAFSSPSNMAAGTNNYFLIHDATNLLSYVAASLVRNATQDQDISGTARRWRSDRLGSASSYFPGELPMVAVYNIALSAGQRTALNNALNYSGTATETGTITTVNAGDVTEYPLIVVRGPAANLRLTNLATNDVLDFTGMNLEPSQQLTIDLRAGDKSATDTSGSSYVGNMGTPTQLASWGLAPAPVAAGGTNAIRVQAGSMTSETLITVYHYDRHMSF